MHKRLITEHTDLRINRSNEMKQNSSLKAQFLKMFKLQMKTLYFDLKELIRITGCLAFFKLGCDTN